jgi:hypothetical protein
MATWTKTETQAAKPVKKEERADGGVRSFIPNGL